MTTKQPQTSSTITVHVSLRFAVRGGRKTIIGEALLQTPKTRFDDSIAKGLARAYRWKQKLDNGIYATVHELAKAERINESYVTRILRLNLLAPDIVEAVLNSRKQLTLHHLSEPISPIWMEQRSVLSNSAGS